MLGLHTVVKAIDEGYGEYIGEILGFKGHPEPVYYVKILACTKYPSQYAILIKNVQFRRVPYSYLSIKTISIYNVHIYKGDVPEYEHSVKVAYDEAQQACCT